MPSSPAHCVIIGVGVLHDSWIDRDDTDGSSIASVMGAFIVSRVGHTACIGQKMDCVCRHHRRIVSLSVLAFCIDRVTCVYTLSLVLFMACMGCLCPSDVERVQCVYCWRWAKGEAPDTRHGVV